MIFSHKKKTNFKNKKFRNYIAALNQLLTTEKEPSDSLEFAQMLSEGMSQTTTNLIASLMQVQPRALILAQRASEQRQSSSAQSPPFIYAQNEDSKDNFVSSSTWLSLNYSSSSYEDVSLEGKVVKPFGREEYISTQNTSLNVEEWCSSTLLPNQILDNNSNRL